MILVVGLGNPGKQYELTRHNVGFMVLDGFLKKIDSVKKSIWEENAKFNSFVAKPTEKIILVKPLSFMNASGKPISSLINFYKIPVSNFFLVHDDVDLPLGKIKITVGKGSAGHKGVASVIQYLGNCDFVRIRVGVGKDKKTSTDKFVLLPFEERELAKLTRVVKKAIEALEMILREGVEKTATRYNQ